MKFIDFLKIARRAESTRAAKILAAEIRFFDPEDYAIQPEQYEFKPQVLFDLTPVWETKHRAMESMETPTHLKEDYADLGNRRGVRALRNGDHTSINYAEAFERIYLQVTGELS